MNGLLLAGIIIGGILLLYLICIISTHCCVYKSNKNKKNVQGQVALVTGGTDGIGKQLSIDLFLSGATVVFTGRSKKKVEDTLAQLKKNGKKLNKVSHIKSKYHSLDEGKWDGDNFVSEFFNFRKLDQGSLAQCKAFTAWFAGKFTRLDILVNNAGLMFNTYKETEDGFEYTMGINHYSHFFMTHELINLLKTTNNSRIIHTSSAGHYKFPGVPDSHMDLDDIEWKKSHQKYVKYHRYANSKLANVLFSNALADKFGQEGVKCKSVSIHPGVVRTGFTRNADCADYIMMGIIYPFLRTPYQGAQTLFHTAYIPWEKLENGEYYANNSVSEMKPEARDVKYWKKFWNVSIDQIKSKGHELPNYSQL